MWIVPVCPCGVIDPIDAWDRAGYPTIPIACYYCDGRYTYAASTEAAILEAGWTPEQLRMRFERLTN